MTIHLLYGGFTLKTIFITGCSSGIGFLAANSLKARGYRVIASCRKPADYEKLLNLGFETVLLDLDDPDSVEEAANKVLDMTNHRLYGLFNNAGFGVYGRLQTLSRSALEAQFSTNFFGVHQLTQRLLPAMLTHGEGRIIQTSSIVGIIATPGRGAYAASKFALEAWSDALRLELAHTGIKVSLIEPGPLMTSFSDNVAQSEQCNIVENPPIAKRFTLPAQAILPKLYHALESRHPKVRYRVTLITTLASVAKRLLPDKLMDKILINK